MDKRGWTYTSSRSKLSLIIGALCVLIGIIPLLTYASIVIPGVSDINVETYNLIVYISLFIGGIFLLYDSFAVRNMMTGRIKGASVLAGIIMAVVGIFPLALQLKLLDFLPFVADLGIPSAVWYSLLVFYGIYLMIDAFVVRDYRFF
jgi:hypothetical protein